LVTLLSFVIGQLPWFLVASAPMRAQIGGLFVFVLSAVAFLLVAHRVDRLQWLEWITWPFLMLGGLYIAGRIVPGLWQVTDRLFQYGVTGSLFWTWLAAMAGGQLLFNRRLHLFQQFALIILLLGLFYLAYINRDWKSGWIPPLAAVATCLVLYSWRLGLLLAVGGMMLAGVILTNLITSDSYSFSTRWDAWLIVVNIVQANPIFGLGPANYYWYTPLFPIRGYAVKFNSHSQYVDLVAQTGLLGLFCFGWFIWELGWLAWRLRTSVPEGFARGYLFGALGGLVGTLVASALGDWFLPFVYNVGIAGMRASILGWVFLGGLLSLACIVHSEAETPLSATIHARKE
jgi:O-antigen ligase